MEKRGDVGAGCGGERREPLPKRAAVAAASCLRALPPPAVLLPSWAAAAAAAVAGTAAAVQPCKTCGRKKQKENQGTVGIEPTTPSCVPDKIGMRCAIRCATRPLQRQSREEIMLKNQSYGPKGRRQTRGKRPLQQGCLAIVIFFRRSSRRLAP